jgi:hypothetical protein
VLYVNIAEQRRSDAKRSSGRSAICEHGRPRLATGVRAGVLFVSMAGLKAQSQGTWADICEHGRQKGRSGMQSA